MQLNVSVLVLLLIKLKLMNLNYAPREFLGKEDGEQHRKLEYSAYFNATVRSTLELFPMPSKLV